LRDLGALVQWDQLNRLRNGDSASGSRADSAEHPLLQAIASGSTMVTPSMPSKLNTEILTAAITGFEEQKKRLDAHIAELRQMLTPSAKDGAARSPGRRRMSAAARARIAAAQRKRWAASRKQAGVPSSSVPRKKRKLSAAGRKAIIEATKRRWAVLRKAQARNIVESFGAPDQIS